MLDRTKLDNFAAGHSSSHVVSSIFRKGTEQAEFLRQLQLFQNWPKDHLERFSSQLRRLKFKAGEYVFRQMHDSNGIYFIKAFTDQ